jgi:flavin-dependent dehydrogenase
MAAEKTRQSTRCDVLIVGGGPAGAAAARYLVQIGYRVLILEKKKLPRYKICSGLVLDRSQDLLARDFGTPPESVFCRPKFLKGVRLCAAEDSMIDAPVEKPEIFNVWRSEFDHWLVQKSGADVLEEHELIGYRQTEDGVQASILTKRKEALQIDASYLIGADGGNSRVRRLLDPAFEEQINWFIPTQLYCIGTVNLEREYFYGFLDRTLSAFYAWLNFKDDYLIYGVATEKGGHIEPYLTAFTEYLEKYFQLNIEKVVRKTGCLGADMGIKGNFMLGKDRVLLVGEAAGFMNMFGEGISSALATGRIAGEAVHQAQTSGETAISLYHSLAEPEKQLTTSSWELAKTLAGSNF